MRKTIGAFLLSLLIAAPCFAGSVGNGGIFVNGVQQKAGPVKKIVGDSVSGLGIDGQGDGTDDVTITNSGLNIASGEHLTIGSTQLDNGSDKIDGEQIADDTIDDDSIDLSDVTLADFTNDAGYLTANQTITLSGDVTGSGTTSITTAISPDSVDDTMIDWGTGTGQVSTDDVTEGSTHLFLTAAERNILSNTSGTNTGDQDLSGYLAATGATTGATTQAQTFTNGVITPKIYPSADSTTAIQINKADGTTNVLNVDTTNGRVGIGTTSPSYELDINNPSIDGRFYIQTVGGNVVTERFGDNTSGSNFDGYKARGTKESLTSVQYDDSLCNYTGKGYDGSNFYHAGNIQIRVDGTPDTASMPGKIIFYTTPSGSTTDNERMRIDSLGNIAFGTINSPSKFTFNGNIRVVNSTDDLDSEKITNGTFDTSADSWTLGDGWVYSSGRARKTTDGVGTLSQTSAQMATPLVAGEWYTLAYSISYTTGTIGVSIAGVDLKDYNGMGTGSISQQFKAVDDSDLVFTPSYSSRFTVDNVSLKRMTSGNIETLGYVQSAGLGVGILPTSTYPGYIAGNLGFATPDGNLGGYISTTGLSTSSNGLAFNAVRTGGTLNFSTNSISRLYISNPGLVGIGTTSPSARLHTTLSDSGTSSVAEVDRIEHITSGTAAAGFGASQDYYLEDAGGTSEQSNRIASLWTDATHATRTSALTFSGVTSGGALTEWGRFQGGNFGVGTTNPVAALDVATRVTASSGVGYGIRGMQTLTAAANNDVLEGLRIDTTYADGAYTGVTHNLLDLLNAGVSKFSVDGNGNATATTVSCSPTISTGTSAPSSTPSKIGDIFVDYTNKKLYFATGISSSSDWTIAN